MDFRGFAEALRASLVEAKQSGIAAVDLDSLLAHVDQLEQAIATQTDASPETLAESNRRAWERYLEEHRAYLSIRNDMAAKMFDSVILAGQTATRLLFTMNGAAAIAILAFVGHLAQIGSPMVPAFTEPLLLFTGGVALSGLVAGMTYVAQFAYAYVEHWKWSARVGHAFSVITIISWLCALGVFIWGLVAARSLFQEFVVV